MDGFPIEKFNDFLLPCVVANNENLFFRDYGLHNQSVFYYLMNQQTKQKSMLMEITDTRKLTATDDLYHETARRLNSSRNPMANNTAAQQSFYRDVVEDVWFYQSILSIPTYNPLLMVRDSVFIFNHIDGFVNVYNKNGDLQRTFSIDYQNREDWDKELIIDYSGDEIYARLNDKGITRLLLINPDNGSILSEFKLDKNRYPTQLRIRDGYVYYLYTDKYDLVVSNVYKQKLE